MVRILISPVTNEMLQQAEVRRHAKLKSTETVRTALLVLQHYIILL